MIIKEAYNIDRELGNQLMNGLDWLQNWLKVHKLEKNIRPMNILIQVARLLATPRNQLMNVSI